MAKAPGGRQRVLRSKRATAGIIWALSAVLLWVLIVVTGAAGWWQILLAASATVSAVLYLATWRLWRLEWSRA